MSAPTQPSSKDGKASPIPGKATIISPSVDLAGGVLPSGAHSGVQQELLHFRDRRWMRWIAFVGIGITCLAFFACLLAALHRIWGDKEFIAILVNGDNWHSLVLAVSALAIFAAVPLSLSLALVRLISEEKIKDDVGLTIPQLELFKVVIDAIRQIKS